MIVIKNEMNYFGKEKKKKLIDNLYYILVGSWRFFFFSIFRTTCLKTKRILRVKTTLKDKELSFHHNPPQISTNFIRRKKKKLDRYNNAIFVVQK